MSPIYLYISCQAEVGCEMEVDQGLDLRATSGHYFCSPVAGTLASVFHREQDSRVQRTSTVPSLREASPLLEMSSPR